MSQTKAKKPEPLISRHDNQHETNASESEETTETPHATHERPHAAHLKDDTAKPHTKPEGDLRQGSHPGGRRQP